MGVLVDVLMKLRERHTPDFGEKLSGVACVSRHTWALASHGVGREEGCVGLDHDPRAWDEFRGLCDFFRVAVGHDPCERDARAEIKDHAGFVWSAGKAMEDKPIRVEFRGSEDREQIGECLSAMDHDRECVAVVPAGLDRCELLCEDGVLDVLRRMVVVVVESELAERDAFGMLCVLLEHGPVVWPFVGIQRVHTCGAPDPVVLASESQCVVGVLCGGRDGDRAGDAELRGFIDDLVDPTGIVGKGQMTVGINHTRI